MVNGDPSYDARTTRLAVELMVESERPPAGMLKLEQRVETPIGSGFGTSAASAIAAVYAAAGVMGIRKAKEKLALYAHRAEIIEQTGLGTVSVAYKATGAGAITKAGVPGEARFKNVKVPKETRIVTASLAPYDKKDALSSGVISDRVNRLGGEALEVFLADPSLDSLAAGGERFSRGLGLESPEVRKLLRIAKSAGARYASQNMIGYAIHAIVDLDNSRRVVRSLSSLVSRPRVDTYEVGAVRAGLVSPSRR
ncbi:MAG: hypothetical protein OK404_02430 [Thaumarchaeota archaeon]|nr:hypothetical protein [Nitrososphaerota archaeon]